MAIWNNGKMTVIAASRERAAAEYLRRTGSESQAGEWSELATWPAYPIRLKGKLKEDLKKAAAIFDLSESEIIGKAVRKARRIKPAVVVDKNNQDDHKSDYGDPVKVYDFDPEPENDPALFRAYLAWYLAQYDLTAPPSRARFDRIREEAYHSECTMKTAVASAVIQQEELAVSFEQRITRWQGWKEKEENKE